MADELREALDACRRRVDAALKDAFGDIRPAHLRDATRWYPDAGGKRLRPAMAMLACEAVGGRAEDALPVAMAVEMVHNFSLVHDDIMDRDETRRGRPTVHKKWDEATAILAGDVLFARAFEVLADIPDPQAHHSASRLLSRAIRRLCEGQAMDVAFESQSHVGVAEYLDMIDGKTAVLFEAATQLGALSAPDHAPRKVEALARFGRGFGMAFQVADDVLDVTADSKTLGKPWGSDVRAGKRTLLVLEAQARANPEQRAVLDAVLGDLQARDEDVGRVLEVFRASGALQKAFDTRDAYAKDAAAALDVLPDSPARGHLLALNEWARTRGF